MSVKRTRPPGVLRTWPQCIAVVSAQHMFAKYAIGRVILNMIPLSIPLSPPGSAPGPVCAECSFDFCQASIVVE